MNIFLKRLIFSLSFVLIGNHGANLHAAVSPRDASTVEVNALDDTSDGACDASHCSLREAITTANGSAARITFASGLTGAIELTSPLPHIRAGVTLVGPGASALEVKLAAGSNFRIFVVQKGSAATVISGLKLSGGKGQADTAYESGDPTPQFTGTVGGAIRSLGSLTVEDCILTGNSADRGGAIYSLGSLRIRNSEVTGNMATEGGGVYQANSNPYSPASLILDSSRFLENSAASTTGPAGGGAINTTENATVTACTFTGNSVSSTGGLAEGGAIHTKSTANYRGSLDLNLSTFSGNSAITATGSANGGAINSKDVLNIVKCSLLGNKATATAGGQANGGGLYSVFATTEPYIFPSLERSTVANNIASSTSSTEKARGGGIYGAIWANRSTIYGNSAQVGGGIYCFTHHEFRLQGSTLTGNSASIGGGVASYRLGLKDTILAGNDASIKASSDFSPINLGSNPEVVCYYSVLIGIKENFNVRTSGGSYKSGTVASPFDVKLAPLADNGGPTQTCALLDGSPAIDAAYTSDATDQRGFPLRTDFRLNPPESPVSGVLADVGAYEFEPPFAVRVFDTVVRKPYAGLRDAIFQVGFSVPAKAAASLHWQTTDGTATAPTDYLSSEGTLLIASGDTSALIKVPILSHETPQSSKKFHLSISQPENLWLTGTTATAEILDYGLPTLYVDNPSVYEPVSGTSFLKFSVTLDRTFEAKASVTYSTVSGTASADDDFISQTGTVEFEPWEWKKSIDIAVKADSVDEAPESLRIVLSQPHLAQVDNSNGLGTILNYDKTPPLVRIDTPLSGAILTKIPSTSAIAGTATDSRLGDSGIKKVTLTWRRNSDNRYWGLGSSWVSERTEFPVETFSTGYWRTAQNYPGFGGAPVSDDTYIITATAYDEFDNTATDEITFILDGKSPPQVSVSSPIDGLVLK